MKEDSEKEEKIMFLSEESAILEFQKILDRYEVDWSDLESEIKSAMDRAKRKILIEIQKGCIAVCVSDNDDFTVTQKLKRTNGLHQILQETSCLTYQEVTAKHKIQNDGIKNDVKSGYNILAQITGVPLIAILGLKGADLKIAEALLYIFSQL